MENVWHALPIIAAYAYQDVWYALLACMWPTSPIRCALGWGCPPCREASHRKNRVRLGWGAVVARRWEGENVGK